jgi:putative ABC transport system permease protein
MLNNSRTQNGGTGADMIVHAGSSSALMNLSGATTPMVAGGVLHAIPHVEVASPVYIKLAIGGTIENLFGIDYPTYNDLRPFTFLSGGSFAGPNDIIVDELQAQSKHLKIGDSVKAMNHNFRVCGIVAKGKGANKYIPLATMQDMESNPNKVTAFYLKTDRPPAFQDRVRRDILATPGLGDWSVQTMDEVLAALMPDKLPGFNIALRVVVTIAAIIGFLAIFQSMYTAVMERTREIGILKSMGAGRGTIVSVVLRETGLLAVIGVAVGVIGTFVLQMFLHHRFPTMSFQITPAWVLAAVVITLSGALMGAAYPALKAAQKDPIDALAYE